MTSTEASRDAGPNPSGLCGCGCGETTAPSTRSYPRRGIRRGEPCRFITGHNTRLRTVVLVCTVEGCNRAHKARGLCYRHWKAFRKSPDFTHRWVAKPRPPSDFGSAYLQQRLDHLRSKIEWTVEGCWIWTGYVAKSGYGQICIAGRHVLTHRFVYEQTVGRVPDGKLLDHLCRNRSCCNPGHLEPVTHRENALRGFAALAAAVTR